MFYRILPLFLVVLLCSSCGKIFQVSDLLGPDVTSEERSGWEKTVQEKYQPADHDPAPAEQQIVNILDEAGELETFNRLREVLEEKPILNKGKSLSHISSYSLYAPLSLERLSRDLTWWPASPEEENDSPQFPANSVFRRINQEMARLLGAKLEPDDSPSFAASGAGETETLRKQCVNYIIEVITAAQERVDKAYAALDEDEKTAILHGAPELMEEFIDRHYVRKSTMDLSPDGSSLLETAGKIDYGELLRSMTIISMLAKPQFLELLAALDTENAEPAQSSDLDPRLHGRFLIAQQTPIGLVLIGAGGPNTYGADAAVIIDLGGDDLYTNNSGAPVYEIEKGAIRTVTSPIGVVIDLEGNDRYISKRFASLGAGFFGLGLILDAAGNDFYSGDQLTEGSGFLGVGYLIDMAGDDNYICQETGQGAAVFGAGLLWDMGGDDLYSGAEFVQGFGGPQAVGRLVDMQGNDHYSIGGKKGSTYGTPGIYQGYGQGVGWGFRGLAGGGLGILHDLRGDDTYEAGDFAQGTGYYFGLGLLRDDQGDDKYYGGRYCQGAAAHSSAGILIDYMGNDVYSGEIAANQGAAWDVSVAGLFDYTGNDVYIGADLSLGAGAQNGLGIFFDGNGDDVYITDVNSAAGFSGALTYDDGRNAKNLGIFIDSGEGNDSYPEKSRENNDFIIRGEAGIFLDR